MNKVSVIVPIYNSEECIEKCLKSIIGQTYRNIEIILINDGSTDNSIKILKKYEKKYSFIKVIDKKNEGVAKTRNLGIKISTGKYLMFIDNDDYIVSDYIEKYVDMIEQKQVEVIIGGYQRENSLGKKIETRKLKNTEWSKYIIMAPWGKIYLREYLIKNEVEFLTSPIGEDVYFTLKLISLNAKFYVSDYIGYTWYFNEKSVSNTSQRGIKKEINILNLLNELKKMFNESNQYVIYYFYKYCVWYLLFSGKSASKQSFIESYNKYWFWLKKNNYYKTISPFSRKLEGESLRDRICVFMFKIIDRLHLIKIFATIYCRGE